MLASFQQLFHIPCFRSRILQVDFSKPESTISHGSAATSELSEANGETGANTADSSDSDSSTESVESSRDFFYYIQEMFGRLSRGDSKYYDLKNFCEVATIGY